MRQFLSDAATIFLSLSLESLPFVLLGSLLSTMAGLFLTEARLKRLLPARGIAGLPAACLLGLVVPLCDCGTFPLGRRLLSRGVPASHVAAFLASAPILNPAVIASTVWAFSDAPDFVPARIFTGLLAALFAAGFVTVLLPRLPAAPASPRQDEEPCGCHEHSVCGCGHHHDTSKPNWKSFPSLAASEFAENLSWVILGAAISSLVQVAVPRTLLLSQGRFSLAAILGSLGFSWFISLCSNADAFVARSFLGPLGPGAALSFMTFGAMLDLKNTFPLLALFPRRFALGYALGTFLACLLCALLFRNLGAG